MIVQTRKRLKNETEHERVFTYDLVLESGGEEESKLIDLLGNTVGDDGLIVTGKFEVRLADGYGEHYVLLKGEKEHVEPR